MLIFIICFLFYKETITEFPLLKTTEHMLFIFIGQVNVSKHKAGIIKRNSSKKYLGGNMNKKYLGGNMKIYLIEINFG